MKSYVLILTIEDDEDPDSVETLDQQYYGPFTDFAMAQAFGEKKLSEDSTGYTVGWTIAQLLPPQQN